jgi:hypothetical protein
MNLPVRLIRLLAPLLAFAALRAADAGGPAALRLGAGPHLFIDDYLIAEQSFLTRTINQPAKRPEPVITGRAGGDDNFQPYLSVLRDPDTGRFRVWYGTAENESQSHVATMESADGIDWQRPHRVLQDPQKIQFGVSVVDRGRGHVPADQRYVLAFWEGGGMRLAVSPDGLDWRMLAPGVVWEHNHDINSLHWDPIRQHYLAIGSVFHPSPRWEGRRRMPHQSVSRDLLHWEEKWPIITPKIGAPIEQGELQFYSMSGVIARGDLLIGMVKVLRDDLNATPGKTAAEMGDPGRKAAGLGYTVLAWSRDGRTWQRDHEPFLANDPDPARWDHAMAWGDEQIVVGDETFVYYGGYRRGHKAARYDERQLGLARMPRDRYVAREADLNRGRLLTKPFFPRGETLTVNARVVGELRVRLCDAQARPLEGFGWSGIQGDSVQAAVRWSRALSALGEAPVRLEFELRDAQLFGFGLP